MFATLLDANRIDDAKAMQPELKTVLSLPYEHDLTVRYLMLATRLLFKEHDFANKGDNFDAAEKNVKTVEPLLSQASNETLILYYTNKAHLFTAKGDIKSALKCYHNSIELFGDKMPYARIYQQMSHCYILLHKYHHAIRYIQHARASYEGDMTNPMSYVNNELLASCYANTGEYKKAEELFEMSYNQSKLSGNEIAQGLSLYNMAEMAMNMGNYDTALEKLDMALQLIEKNMSDVILYNKHVYIFTIYSKAVILAKLNRENKEIIELGRPLAEGDETLTIILDTAYHLGKINSADSENYLEKVTIPHLLSCGGHEMCLLLAVCKELEAHYKKKKSKTKAAYMAAIIRDIYEDMFMGDVE